MPRRKDIIILWPCYFDRTKTRKEGRRVPKKLAIQDPTAEIIAKTARDLGYYVEIEPEKSHPSEPRKGDGRVIVAKTTPKSDIILQIASRLKDQRS
ncbi:MAG: signal recognition particle subunit SRP19/SEC65 family protein [Thermoplasmata archaeon]